MDGFGKGDDGRTGAVDRGHRDCRREPEFSPLRNLVLGEADGIPTDHRLHRAESRVGDDHHCSPTCVGTYEHGGGQPAPNRLFAGSQFGAIELRPRVQQDGGAVTVFGNGLGARGADHNTGTAADAVDDLVSARGEDRNPRECAAQFFGRPASPRRQRPHLRETAFGAAEVGIGMTTPPAAQQTHRVAVWPGTIGRQGPVCLHRSVASTATYMRTAPFTGQRR